MRSTFYLLSVAVILANAMSDEYSQSDADFMECQPTNSSMSAKNQYVDVVLSDCTKCRVRLIDANCSQHFFGDFVATGRPQDVNAPAWYIEKVTKPYIEYNYCGDVHTCFYDQWTDFELVNSSTLEIASHNSLCTDYAKQFTLKHLATYGLIFHNISSWQSPLQYGISRTGTAANFAFSLAMPLQVFALLFGKYVVKRALHGSESHIIVYHSALVYADILLCVVNFLQTMFVLDLILLPICFASPILAIRFSTDGPQLGDIIQDCIYIFANILQSILAVDRLLAVTVPLWYRKRSTVPGAVKVVLFFLVVNILLWLFLTLTNEGVFSTILQEWPGTDFLALWYFTFWTPIQNVLTSAVVLLTFSIQFCCCCALLYVVVRRKSHQSQQSLLPCFLLLGTCGVNLCSGTPCLAYYLAKTIYNMCRNEIICPRPQSFFDFLYFLDYYRHSIVSLLNSLGVCVHCVVSKRYRQVAVTSIRNFSMRLKRVFGFKKSIMVAPLQVRHPSGQVDSSRIILSQNIARGNILLVAGKTQSTS